MCQVMKSDNKLKVKLDNKKSKTYKISQERGKNILTNPQLNYKKDYKKCLIISKRVALMKNRQIWLKNRQMWLKKILKNKVQDGTIIHTASEIIIKDIVILIIVMAMVILTAMPIVGIIDIYLFMLL